MPDLPLYFDFTVQLTGPAFRADVRIQGRATCVAEFGETWIYGVNPGSLAASGPDVQGAFAAFKDGIAESLCDLAEETGAFPVFRSAVRRFVAATNRASVAEWDRARQAVRDGATAHPSLRRETREIAPSVTVSERTGSAEAVGPARASANIEDEGTQPLQLLAA